MFSWFKRVLSAPNLAGIKAPDNEQRDQMAPPKNDVWHITRGNECLSRGQLEEAAECYQQAIAINPGFADGHLNLGFALHGLQRYEKAKAHLEQAIQLNPGKEDAFYLLGTIAQVQGDLDGAIDNFNKALDLKPDFEIVYRDLCHVLFLSGQRENAKKIILKGISLNPEFADFHYYLGNLLLEEKETEGALESYQKALLIQPDYAAVHSNMGKAFLEQGGVAEATECYEHATSLDPDDIQSLSCLLFIQSFNAECSPSQYLLEAQAFGRKVLALATPFSSWNASPTPAAPLPLRVGLISGDLRNHPVGYFLESILSHLNRNKIELVAYSTRQEEDNLTARIKHRFVAWNSITELSDEAAARRIHADGIHILIDLAGHTSYNRLPVFAWKPAPVQACWLGYLASTGVPGMDFLLADRISVPEQHREHFSEKIWYLPNTVNCLTPPVASAKLIITPPPVLHTGRITFGSFQNLTKINDEVLALWAKIFNALPQADLHFHCKQMTSQSAREKFRQRLVRFGILPERVSIKGFLPAREDFLATYAEVDFILDSFPYPGITTTCEALWMGVPTLTLAGDTMLSRQGASLLTCIGLQDWIAHSREEYVALALAHAADVNKLVQLRAGLRQKALASPLFDAPLFAKHLEDALQGMWQQSYQDVISGNRV
jgi:protein O-GlcNAc transferase